MTKIITWKGVLGVRELKSYVDPYPDKIGTDRVPEECGRCGGSGYTCFTWVHGGICFHCDGSGKHYAAVSTVRKRIKEKAYYRDYAEEIETYHDAVRAENETKRCEEEFEQAWVEAHEEQTRRATLVQGFIGEVDDKVSNLHGVVQVAKGYESHFGYRTQYGMFLIVKLDSGQVVKISGTGSSLFGHDRGDEITILSAKVREHDVYHGQEQTALMRVKIEES